MHLAQCSHQHIDGTAFNGGQHIAIHIQRALRGHEQALGIHARFNHGALLHVMLCGGKAFFQHAGDLVVRQAVGWLHIHLGLHAAGLLLGGHAEQAVRIHGEGHADARRACSHGRNAAQLEARQAAAVLHQIALALHHMDRHGGLAIFVGGEVLRLGGGNGFVAADDALDQATHGLDAQRQRDHVEQQQVACGVIARELIGLDGGAQRHHLIGIKVGERRLAEEFLHCLLHLQHARGATDHHHALHFVARDLRITQRLAHRRQRALGERCRCGIEIFAAHIQAQVLATKMRAERGQRRCRQRFLAGTRCDAHRCFFCGRGGRCAQLRQCPFGQSSVVVITAQCRIATRSDDFENAFRQTQHRDVERAATQVIHGIDAFGGIVQAVGNRRCRRFIDESQQVQARQLGRVLGGLALGIVEICWHGDHRTIDVVVEAVFGAKTQRGQNFRAHLHGGFLPACGLDRHHALPGQRIGQRITVGNVVEATAHQALDGCNCVLWVAGARAQRVVTNLPAVVGHIAHDRRKQHPALVIRQAFRNAVAHGCYEGMRGAQVNAHRDPPLMGIGGLTGF
ncbi:hypothetical protein SDC9_110483 [bioreactor metagenome]|uniref:Uncharacterized protein n=1 Tax=bioreactor metagenome TaxID=1076179 RepID=A0A645BE34_9ZZZZ